MQRFIKIDGKVRTDITYPAGFMGESVTEGRDGDIWEISQDYSVNWDKNSEVNEGFLHVLLWLCELRFHIIFWLDSSHDEASGTDQEAEGAMMIVWV